MDRFKFRLWDKDNECYDYIDFRDLSRTNETLTTYEEYFYNGYFERNQDCIEQCTGLKDKNGNLIYEGDIVYDSVYENNFVVSWDNDRTGYFLSTNNTNHIDYLSKILIERHNLKIIGNIHEQKD